MNKEYMLEEIREQPEILRRTRKSALAFLYSIATPWDEVETIYLLGCGDMDFSARISAWLSRGACALRSMDMRWMAKKIGPKDLVLGASFSGRTPRTQEAAILAKKEGLAVWGITGNQDSDFAALTEKTLVLHTGPEEELNQHVYAGYHHNVPQTKTFLAVLYAELLILEQAGRLISDELYELPEKVAELLPRMEEAVDRFMEKEFRSVSRVSVLGSGPFRAVAAYGAAKFLEMAVPARHQCMEENNHLEMFVTDKSEFMIFCAPDAPSWTRAQELLEPYSRFDALRLALTPSVKGVHLLPLPEGGPVVQTFGLILALQLLSQRVGRALGRDIDQWVGGQRTALIEEMGQELVRNSRILG